MAPFHTLYTLSCSLWQEPGTVEPGGLSLGSTHQSTWPGTQPGTFPEGTGQCLGPLAGLRVRVFLLVKSTWSINRSVGHVPFHSWWDGAPALLSSLCFIHCSNSTTVAGKLIIRLIQLLTRNILIFISNPMGKAPSYPLSLFQCWRA